MTIQKFTRHPIVSISAVCLGILCGMYAKTAARFLSNIGDIFLLLLNMCSLPILVTSIISSVGMVIVGKNRNGEGIRVRRMVGYYAAACLIVEVLAAVVCSIIGLNEAQVHVIMPLGTVIARFSMMILYVSGMMFASQLYGIPLSPLQLAEGLFLCALASIAGVGSPMMVSLSLFSLIFVPLGIPYTAVITLHMLVIIAVDPVLTMENTHINSTLTVFLGGVSKKI